MANDGVPATPAVRLATGSQAPKAILAPASGGKSLPPNGTNVIATAESVRAAGAPGAAAKGAPAVAKATGADNQADLRSLLTQLNKALNDSGRPNQFRVDPASQGRTIQEINPATGEVIGEFSVSEFPALARSLGVSGILVDSHA